MTTTTGNTYAYHLADQEHTRHVLLQDDEGA